MARKSAIGVFGGASSLVCRHSSSSGVRRISGVWYGDRWEYLGGKHNNNNNKCKYKNINNNKYKNSNNDKKKNTVDTLKNYGTNSTFYLPPFKYLGG